MSDLAAFLQTEKAEWDTVAGTFLASRAIPDDYAQTALEALRKKEWPGDEAPSVLAALALATGQPDTIRDDALLGLYYVMYLLRNYAEYADHDAASTCQMLLDVFCQDVTSEPSPHLRGRMHWVRLQRLKEEEAPPQTIADYALTVLRNSEESDYAKERVGAALRRWDGIHYLLPCDGTWKVPDGDDWKRLSRFADRRIGQIGTAIDALSSRMPDLLRRVADGKIEAETVEMTISSLPVSIRELLAHGDLVNSILARTDAGGRNRVLAACTGLLNAADLPRLRDYVAGLRSALADVAENSLEWKDRSTRLALDATVANLSPDDEGLRELAPEALSLLSDALPPTVNNSSVRYRMAQMAGAVVRLAISESVGADDVPLLDASQIATVIQSEYPFISRVGADIALLLVRRAALPDSLIEPMKAALASDPSTASPFCYR
jgi:hypothetical protein